MKRTHGVPIIMISLLFLLPGCKTKGTASGNSANDSKQPAGSADANRNENAAANDSRATQQPSEPPKLIGSYEAREIEDKGVVTMISQIKTIFVFTADGTYQRVSQAKGKTYHSDSGHFQIEPPDKLIITIQISDRNMKNPAVIKTHRFSLSPDGDDLKLTNEKGTTATYHRTAKPKAS
jgi:hypothetical protein